MAARPTWKGFMKISLVNIPVRVFPATDSAATISFNQLHAECQTRIQQKRWCPHCEREVPISEVVKGYEFEKGRYVVMNEDDVAKVRPESTRVIDLVQFTDAVSIDPIYFERPYYLAPDGAMATEAFAVMREGMKGKAGIGKLALYGREYLVAVQPAEYGPGVSGVGAAAGEGAGDVHHAARARGPEHGQHRRARDGARQGQAGRNQARQAGDRKFRGRVQPRGIPRRVPGRTPADHRRQDCRRRSGRDGGGDAAQGREPDGRTASE